MSVTATRHSFPASKASKTSFRLSSLAHDVLHHSGSATCMRGGPHARLGTRPYEAASLSEPGASHGHRASHPVPFPEWKKRGPRSGGKAPSSAAFESRPVRSSIPALWAEPPQEGPLGGAVWTARAGSVGGLHPTPSGDPHTPHNPLRRGGGRWGISFPTRPRLTEHEDGARAHHLGGEARSEPGAEPSGGGGERKGAEGSPERRYTAYPSCSSRVAQSASPSPQPRPIATGLCHGKARPPRLRKGWVSEQTGRRLSPPSAPPSSQARARGREGACAKRPPYFN